MNNDDTFKNTNNNDRTSAGLTPELEVRVVAWVLGEATPAEAAELARLAAENPALAEFKRRIEAVHGLVGAAARPVGDATLRLSDERRTKLLAVIGEAVGGGRAKTTTGAARRTPRWVQAWNQWALPMAACITLCVLLGAVMTPAFQKVGKPKRPNPSSTVLGAERTEMRAVSGPSGSDGIQPTDVVVAADAPMVSFAVESPQQDKSAAQRDGFSDSDAVGGRRENAPAPAATMPVPTAAPMSRGDSGGMVTLSGANTYTGATAVSGGQLGLSSGEKAASLSESRPSEEKQLSLGLDARVPAAPAMPSAALAASGPSSSGYATGMVQADASVAYQPALRSGGLGGGAGGLDAVASATRSRRVREDAGYADKDKERSLGDMVFRDQSSIMSDAVDALKSEASTSNGVAQGANRGVDLLNATQVTVASGVAADVNINGTGLEEAKAAPKPAKKRQTITITAGTPQEFEIREVTESEQREFNQRMAERRLANLLDTDLRTTSAQQLAKEDSSRLSTSDTKRMLDTMAVMDEMAQEQRKPGAPALGKLSGVDPATNLETAFIPLLPTTSRRFFGVVKRVQPNDNISDGLKAFFQQAGVDFNGVSGARLTYDGSALIVSQTPRNIERMRNILARYPDPIERPDIESLRVETATNQQAVSTFSLHVSDASFRLAKAALARGEAPDPASIRPEEFYNAFDYGDPSPVAGEPVACRIEQAAHPFVQQRNLVRIAMKVPATGRGAGQPLRLTVLLDTSGSMEREDRASAVRAALTSLVSLLGPNDRITLIGFARQPHLLADRVPGNQAAGLVDIVARTPFEGGTNLEEALKLAGNLARGQFTATAQNRIVLLTDGAANLGNDDPAQLSSMIAALRQQGIAFDACGVGADGLDDTILEALTRKGDGRYTVINSPEEADAGFAKKLAGAFRPAAENVKVQVRFNPARVAHYRLIGFEQHRLKTEDFRNDRVDAAELAAEEAAVALYQVEVIPDGEGELGEVFVRFRDVAAANMVERSWTLAYAPQPPAFDRATPSMKLAGTAAFLAEKLRGGNLAAQIRLAELAPVVNALRGDYAHDARVRDLVTMFAQARRLAGE